LRRNNSTIKDSTKKSKYLQSFDTNKTKYLQYFDASKSTVRNIWVLPSILETDMTQSLSCDKKSKCWQDKCATIILEFSINNSWLLDWRL